MLAVAANKLELPQQCIKVLSEAQEKVTISAFGAVKNAAIFMMQDQEDACREQLQMAAEQTGVHLYTVTAVMLVMAIPMMQAVYEDARVSQELMWDSLMDVKCKLQEEYNVSGIWGTAVIGWYIRLFAMKIIKLGRLEFEPVGYKWDTPWNGIHKGDPVINMHIPSTGPLKCEDVLDALQRAYRFFGYTQPMPVAIASWMTYPPICEGVFKPDSNMKKFYDLFTVVEQYEDPENHNFWRVFNMVYEDGILDKVPTDTSLRLGIRDYMKTGRHMGVGRCMLLFDGEKVITK